MSSISLVCFCLTPLSQTYLYIYPLLLDTIVQPSNEKNTAQQTKSFSSTSIDKLYDSNQFSLSSNLFLGNSSRWTNSESHSTTFTKQLRSNNVVFTFTAVFPAS